jgi:hypothetical protein
MIESIVRAFSRKKASNPERTHVAMVVLVCADTYSQSAKTHWFSSWFPFSYRSEADFNNGISIPKEIQAEHTAHCPGSKGSHGHYTSYSIISK